MGLTLRVWGVNPGRPSHRGNDTGVRTRGGGGGAGYVPHPPHDLFCLLPQGYILQATCVCRLTPRSDQAPSSTSSSPGPLGLPAYSPKPPPCNPTPPSHRTAKKPKYKKVCEATCTELKHFTPRPGLHLLTVSPRENPCSVGVPKPLR